MSTFYHSGYTEDELLNLFCTCRGRSDEGSHSADCFFNLADRLAFAQELSIERGEN